MNINPCVTIQHALIHTYIHTYINESVFLLCVTFALNIHSLRPPQEYSPRCLV